jgi:hypothetical protein
VSVGVPHILYSVIETTHLYVMYNNIIKLRNCSMKYVFKVKG